MDPQKALNLANILRYTARYLLLVLSAMVMLFALVSGSEDFGGGLTGLIMNSPNALPWALLLVVVLVAWKWEFVGGILVSILGLGLMIFFNFMGPNFFWMTFLLTCSILVLGLFFLGSWFLRRN